MGYSYALRLHIFLKKIPHARALCIHLYRTHREVEKNGIINYVETNFTNSHLTWSGLISKIIFYGKYEIGTGYIPKYWAWRYVTFSLYYLLCVCVCVWVLYSLLWSMLNHFQINYMKFKPCQLYARPQCAYSTSTRTLSYVLCINLAVAVSAAAACYTTGHTHTKSHI